MNGVNLIPERRRDARQQVLRRRRWLFICSIYAGLLMGVCVGARAYWGRDNYAVAHELEKTQKQVAEFSQTIASMQPKLDVAERQYQAIRVVANQPDWSVLLALLAANMSEDTVLKHCGLSPVLPPPAPAPVAVVGAAKPTRPVARPAPAIEKFKLELSGMGRSQSAVSRFVLRLQETGLFDEVKLVKSSREAFGDSQAVAFQIQATLVEQKKVTP